jgi:hypothetical protein
MKWFNDYRMRLVIVAVVAAIVFGGGNAKADFTFGEPSNLGSPINSASNETVVCLSPDGLEMYFISDRPGGSGDWDIWVTERTNLDDTWGLPENLGPTVNSPELEGGAQMSSDGLTLYFESGRPGGLGSHDIWITTRLSKDDSWTTPVNLGPPVNSPYKDKCPAVSADGLELYFHSDAGRGGVGDSDIWVSTRLSVEEPWGEPTNLGSVVNTTSREEYMWLSPDGLLFAFDSDRPGGAGWFDLWITRRASRGDPWTTPVNVGPPVNGPDDDALGAVAPDGRTLYFISNRAGGLGGPWGDIWQAPISPMVDLDGNGIVDAADMCIIVDHWGTDEPLCDVGPMPWGDGIVDVQDLVVLAEHLFEEFPPLDPVSILVDDFESYIVEGDMFDPNQIYMTWIDGWGDDQNGSQVGYAARPFIELTTVRGGLQSMPFLYDNSSAPISRTFREWENSQDWTLGGPGSVTLWVYGQSENSVKPFFITLKDSAGNSRTVTLPDFDPTTESWQQLSIPLSDFVGVDAKAIKRMYMGVGDRNTPGGSGILYIDDIEVHLPPAP